MRSKGCGDKGSSQAIVFNKQTKGITGLAGGTRGKNWVIGKTWGEKYTHRDSPG